MKRSKGKPPVKVVSKKSGGSGSDDITRWSYSAWDTYDQCGARFDFKYLQRLPEPGPPSYAMARGTDLHAKAEGWLKGIITGPLPKGLEKFKASFEGLKAAMAKATPTTEPTATPFSGVETWWGVDKNWQPIKYDSWVVAKVDAFTIIDGNSKGEKELVLIDHKSGKVYPEKHEKQASLYAVLGSRHFPDVDKVTAEFWYLDNGKPLNWTWSRRQLEDWREIWHRRGLAVMSHQDLRARPGWYCQYCPYSKKNKGPCKVM